jgi:hypothetical protein
MKSSTLLPVAAAFLRLSLVPASADDCSPVKAAMITAANTPHTASVTREKNGKPVTNKIIQTSDNKYIEIEGKWRSFGPRLSEGGSVEDKLKTAKLTCAKIGPEQVGGQPATLYTAHMENDDIVSDNRIWLRSDGLPLRVDQTTEDQSYSTVFDYEHAEAPAVSTPVRAR